jgi:hypothetical protein
MIGQTIRLLLILLVLSTPVNAFVEKLMPNQLEEGGIPCNALGAALFFYISPGGPSAGVLGSIIQREWVPQGWSTQDLADNQALITMIDAAPTADEKENLVHRMVFSCMMWEMDVDEFNNPVRYRQRVGLPAAP